MKFFCIYLAAIAFSTCNNSSKDQSNSNDITGVVKKILDDNHLSSVLVSKPDTIFIIKSSNVTKDWPSNTSKYKLNYIERQKKDENLIDLSPQAWNDKRTKIDFGRFVMSKNAASVTIVISEFHELSIYDYKLKYRNEQWIIAKIEKRPYIL
ncbi:hypothetical protein [Pedobacter sandarakinus]|uniref:hypothetical protein n=1 Tax=Pedobacter sandarakinus TaxID=353156 RepID=UPI0022479E26|nr:hypothetical protein [Pedobacter sandarakinus]MCX2573588.1 hypothetical protein [Pedobacter sandarakinus]